MLVAQHNGRYYNITVFIMQEQKKEFTNSLHLFAKYRSSGLSFGHTARRKLLG